MPVGQKWLGQMDGVLWVQPISATNGCSFAFPQQQGARKSRFLAPAVQVFPVEHREIAGGMSRKG